MTINVKKTQYEKENFENKFQKAVIEFRQTTVLVKFWNAIQISVITSC